MFNTFGPIWITIVFVSIILYYSNSLWLNVPKSIGSLKRLNHPKPRYGQSPFSLIRSLLLKDLSFTFIQNVFPTALTRDTDVIIVLRLLEKQRLHTKRFDSVLLIFSLCH